MRMRAAGIGIVIVGLCTGAVLLATIDAREDDSTEAHIAATVVLTKDGFEPEVSIIRVGESVRFRNNRERAFWPASNTHPHHTIYAAFDPQRPIAPGESWVFQFDKPGVWHYHDHLASFLGGSVIVTPDVAALQEPCATDDLSQECIQHTIAQYITVGGADAALDYLATLYRGHPDAQSLADACHNWTHEIGVRTYVAKGKDATLTKKTGYCNDGFYHGFMEGFVNEFPDPQKARRFCDSVRQQFGASYSLAFGQCHHGIGHGIMERAPSVLGVPGGKSDALIEYTVDFCNAASGAVSEEMYFRCVSGGFNVLRNWFMREDLGFAFAADDPYRVCRTQEDTTSKKACYWEFSKGVRALVDNGADPRESYARVFAHIPEADAAYIPWAIRSMAIRVAIAHFVVGGDDMSAIALCRELAGEAHLACIEGSAEGLIAAAEPGTEATRVLAFCGHASLSSREERVCYTAAIGAIGNSYQSDQLGEVCAQTPLALRSEQPQCD